MGWGVGNSFFHRFYCYYLPITSYTLRGLLLLRSGKCGSWKCTGLCQGVEYKTKLWRSTFNLLKQHRHTLQFEGSFFFHLETEQFLPIIGVQSRKKKIGIDEFGYRLEFELFSHCITSLGDWTRPQHQKTNILMLHHLKRETPSSNNARKYSFFAWDSWWVEHFVPRGFIRRPGWTFLKLKT